MEPEQVLNDLRRHPAEDLAAGGVAEQIGDEGGHRIVCGQAGGGESGEGKG